MGDSMGSQHAGRADPGRPFRALPRLIQGRCGCRRSGLGDGRAGIENAGGGGGRVRPDRHGGCVRQRGSLRARAALQEEGGGAVACGVVAAGGRGLRRHILCRHGRRVSPVFQSALASRRARTRLSHRSRDCAESIPSHSITTLPKMTKPPYTGDGPRSSIPP